jgi:phosphoribosyl 1,2-cyclic phosphodiesterase
MRIHFWGVRGSIPAPQRPSQIKSKISSILERLTPADLESSETRERFLAGLPLWLFGTVGGNTPCVSIENNRSREIVVFDSGSGIREMAVAMARKKPKPARYHIFFSHFHWDHINGLPFFYPAYDPAVSVAFYSPMKNLKSVLRQQMNEPYFPARIESLTPKRNFHLLTGKVTLNSLEISYKRMNHPGGSYAYLVNNGKHRFIYATDTELSAADFVKRPENTAFFQGVDVIVLDAQYTLGEALEKYSWGHSAFSMAVDFAANWGIKHIILFHHDPMYDDRKLVHILQSARWYADRMGLKGIKISLATEGLELTL